MTGVQTCALPISYFSVEASNVGTGRFSYLGHGPCLSKVDLAVVQVYSPAALSCRNRSSILKGRKGFLMLDEYLVKLY